MKRTVRKLLGSALRGIVLFKSNEFRITAHDLVRKSTALRGKWSPLNIYLDWRHDEIERLELDFYQNHRVLDNIFDSYYGKLDRIALVTSLFHGSLSVPGDVAEFGVYMGHTSASMHRVLEEESSSKKLYLFDSFQGMPEVTHSLDAAWKKGDLASPLEIVQEVFEGSQHVHIVRGYFSETFPQYPDLKFSFCHVDADLYTSIKECIEYILPRLSVGGVIVFDDYGFRETPGAKSVIHEYFGQDRPNFVPLPTAQAVYFAREGDGVLPSR